VTRDHNQRLAEAMKEVGYPASVVSKAYDGYWSDFRSSIPFPKITLVEMLEQDGHQALSVRVQDGEFDG
jgi:hypothetical protein